MTLRKHRHTPGDERGFALLLTLLVTVILAVVVLEFNYLMRVHATLSGNLIDDLKAETAARAAVEKAKALLLSDLQIDLEEGSESDTLDEEWASEVKVESGFALAEATITDEMSKLNLNRLVERPATETEMESVNETMVESLGRLLELLELDRNLVDVVIDWLDENDEELPFGAESSYYESLKPAIKCKNGPMDSLEELLLVKGFTKKILYGDGESPGLAEFVTVAGDEKGLININTADEKVIAAVADSESLASMLVDAREEFPFENDEDLTSRFPDLQLTGRFATRSSYFLVSATGSPVPETTPPKQVKIKTVLRRVKSEESEAFSTYLSIDTAFWKLER